MVRPQSEILDHFIRVAEHLGNLALSEKNVWQPSNDHRGIVPVSVTIVALYRPNDMLFFRHSSLAISPI